jgi:hypothetical protein
MTRNDTKIIQWCVDHCNWLKKDLGRTTKRTPWFTANLHKAFQ